MAEGAPPWVPLQALTPFFAASRIASFEPRLRETATELIASRTSSLTGRRRPPCGRTADTGHCPSDPADEAVAIADGGNKDSGLGHEGGRDGIQEMLRTKHVEIDLAGE